MRLREGEYPAPKPGGGTAHLDPPGCAEGFSTPTHPAIHRRGRAEPRDRCVRVRVPRFIPSIHGLPCSPSGASICSSACEVSSRATARSHASPPRSGGRPMSPQISSARPSTLALLSSFSRPGVRPRGACRSDVDCSVCCWVMTCLLRRACGAVRVCSISFPGSAECCEGVDRGVPEGVCGSGRSRRTCAVDTERGRGCADLADPGIDRPHDQGPGCR